LFTLTVAAQTQQINGAGATFPYPIYSKWFAEYNKLHPTIQINYQSQGSGAGIQQPLQKVLVAITASIGVGIDPEGLTLHRHQDAQRLGQRLHGLGALRQADHRLVDVVELVLALVVGPAQDFPQLFQLLCLNLGGAERLRQAGLKLYTLVDFAGH